MWLISHRGNMSGPGSARGGENSPEAILHVLDSLYGCYVEADIMLRDNKLWLGHDKPEYELPDELMYSALANRIIWHCKSLKTLLHLRAMPYNRHFFIHNDDDATLTSDGFIWVHPMAIHKMIDPERESYKAIAVMPENALVAIPNSEILKFRGICTDDIYRYRKIFMESLENDE